MAGETENPVPGHENVPPKPPPMWLVVLYTFMLATALGFTIATLLCRT